MYLYTCSNHADTYLFWVYDAGSIFGPNVTMKTTDILKTLRAVAEGSAPVKSARIAAAVVYKGSIISVGTNSYKTDPLQAKYSKNEHAIFMHAEILAIKRALKILSKEEMKKAHLYVVRRKNAAGIMQDGLAKPCIGCQRAIDDVQIQKVIYTV